MLTLPNLARPFTPEALAKEDVLRADSCLEPLLHKDAKGKDKEEALELLSSREKRNFHMFTLLPSELQLYTLTHFSPKDLTSMSATCRSVNAMTKRNSVWRVMSKKKWNLSNTHRFKPMNWRTYCKQQSQLRKQGGLKWVKMEAKGKPAARSAHTGCAIGDKIYYIGGQSKDADTRLAEIHVFDATTGEFTDLTPQVKGSSIPNFARHQAQAVNGKIYCFGGFDLQQFYELAVFDPVECTWSYPTPRGEGPQPRSNHGSAVIGSNLYVFGGSIGDNVNKYETINDFFVLDTEQMVWSKIEAKNTPSERVGHKMIGINGKLVLFGGGVWSSARGWVTQHNDTYIYDPDTNAWEEVKSKVKPSISTYPYIFKLGMNVLLFGGASYAKNNVTKEMWMLDFVSGQWEQMEAEGDKPSARSMGASDVVGGSVFFWGGYCGGVIPSETDFFRLDTPLGTDSERCLEWAPAHN